jgi:frataxin
MRGIMPDAENPEPREAEPHDEPGKPTELTEEEFHERADHYLGELLQRLEEAQEKDPGIEVDYSVRHSIVHYYTSFLINQHRPASWKSRSARTSTS